MIVGMRSSLESLIGFRVDDVTGARSAIHRHIQDGSFQSRLLIDYLDEHFSTVDASETVYTKYYISSRFPGLTLEQVIGHYDETGDFFGVVPLSEYGTPRIHDHPVLWALIQSGVLPNTPISIKIPYEDYTGYIGMDRKALFKIGGISLVRRVSQIQTKGQWNRYYRYDSPGVYDEDLEIAYQTFLAIGLEVERNQIERYISLRWN